MLNSRVSEIEGVRATPIFSARDSRGTFSKFNPLQELNGALDSVAFSFNPVPGTIRGLHFQIEPFAEEKLVTCVLGAIFDVVADLRPDSRTFGKWTSYELSASNCIQLYLPKGVAHGFQTLTSNSVIQYCLSAPYSSENSFAINPIENLGITWPISEFSLSERDASGINFSQAEKIYIDSL